jgi:hypothetical protein
MNIYSCYINLKMTNSSELEFKEIEYKYKANNVDPFLFDYICDRIGKYFKSTKATSRDVFYVRKDINNDKNSYPNIVRYRFNDNNNVNETKELTLKKNTESGNCVNRIEINLKLDESTTLDTVNNFMNILNYKFHYKIIKDFTIYHYDNCELVYYIVFKELDNGNKIEIGRYIEIEAINCKSEEEALNAINKYENLLKSYLFDNSVKLNERINCSLYELCKPAFVV